MAMAKETNNIAKLFAAGVNRQHHGDLPIIYHGNGKDCFILNLPEKDDKLFKEHFLIDDAETILMARDTSNWNNRKEGLVITDRRIIYIPDQKAALKGRYVMNHDSYVRVSYDATSMLFWSSEENFFAIPKKYFFKSKMKSYEFDRAIHLLSKLLNKICDEFQQENDTEREGLHKAKTIALTKPA